MTMDECKSTIFAFAWKAKCFAFYGFLHLLFFEDFSGILGNLEQKYILQTIWNLTKYSVLEIQFWPVKFPNLLVGYAKIPSNIAFLPIQAMQAITTVQWVDWLDEYIKLQKAFKRI